MEPIHILLAIAAFGLLFAGLVTWLTAPRKPKRKCRCQVFAGDNLDCPIHGI